MNDNIIDIIICIIYIILLFNYYLSTKVHIFSMCFCCFVVYILNVNNNRDRVCFNLNITLRVFFFFLTLSFSD